MDEDIEREMVALLPRLRRFALALCRSADEADDLVQATCERAITNLDKWSVGSRLDSWMYRIARNLHLNRLRDKASQRNKLQLVANEPEQTVDGERAAISRIEFERLIGAIGKLPSEQRVVLLLIVVEGRDYREASDILEIPIGTIASRLARARDALRLLVEGE